MKRRNTGQILPLCMFLTAGLLLIVVSNFNIGFFNLTKIQSQKKMDAIALEYGTQYARALNGLAALNEGLEIATERGELVAASAVILFACSKAPPTVLICAPLWQNLKPKLPGFFTHLNKLGKALAKQQDQIIDWITRQRCVDSTISWVTVPDFDMYPKFGCKGSKEDLPFYRPETSDVGDIKKCEPRTTNSYNEFREQLNISNSDEIPIQVTYAASMGEKHIERPMNRMKAQKLQYTIVLSNGGFSQPFTFQSATMEICTTFKGLFASIESGFGQLFQIPSPLVLKPTFFNEQNRIIFISSMKSRFELDPMTKAANIRKPSKLWSLSEIKINGRDFSKMEFYPELSAVSMEEKLWDQIQRKKFWKSLPDLETVKNEINH